MSGPIVCGTDLGASGARAATLAAAIGKALNVGISLVHASEGLPEPASGVANGVEVAADVLRARLVARHADLEAKLASERARLVALGARVITARVVEGAAWEVVSAEVTELGARLAVVGPHAVARPIRDRLLGTTAEQLLRHTTVPVVVATGDGNVAAAAGGDIVVGIDGSDGSLAALTAAAMLARATASHVRAVCVAADSPHAIHALEAARRTFAGPIAWTMESGAPAEAILRVAEQRGAAMIALGTHGRAGLARWALGSVASDVVAAARVPVLVARADA